MAAIKRFFDIRKQVSLYTGMYCSIMQCISHINIYNSNVCNSYPVHLKNVHCEFIYSIKLIIQAA